MKPLSLKITGLNSFRSEQEIPFEKLSELGVFGIFGPTGSGKSTILDGMTLALYGSVVRAGHRIQGILNNAEKELKVSFTFSLGHNLNRQIYKIERRYSKTKDQSLKNTFSRLIKVEEIPVVIADKDREATKEIINLLGLEEEDFTRAVVLPQGKFSEFLQLDGKKRRAMLERLFSLEQYGNILNSRLTERLKNVSIDYAKIEGEQKGLGDASLKSFTAAKENFSKYSQQENLIEVELADAKNKFETAIQISKIQSELFLKRRELENHQKGLAGIKIKAAALEKSGKAEKIISIIQEYRKKKLAEENSLKAKTQAETETSKLEKLTLELNKVLENFKNTRLKEEPLLLEKRAVFLANSELSAQTDLLKQKKTKLETEYKTKEKSILSLSESLEKITKKAFEINENINIKEDFLNKETISAKTRSQIEECQKQSQLLAQQKDIHKSLENAHNKRKENLENALKEATEKEIAKKKAGEKYLILKESEETASKDCPFKEDIIKEMEQKQPILSHLLKLLESNEKNLAREKTTFNVTENELKKFLAQTQKLSAAKEDITLKLAGFKSELQKAIFNDSMLIASHLAISLKEGEECPVCGSLHHPKPASPKIESRQNDKEILLEEDIALVYKSFRDITDKTIGMASKIASLETKAALSEENIKKLEQEKNDIQNHLLTEIYYINQLLFNNNSLNIPKDDAVLTLQVSKILKKIDSVKNILAKWSEERAINKDKLADLKEKNNMAVGELNQSRQKIIILETELQQTNLELKKSEDKLKAIASNLASSLLELGIKLDTRHYLEEGIQKTEILLTNLKQKENLLERTRKELVLLRPEGMALKDKIENLRLSLEGEKSDLTRIFTELSLTKESLSLNETELNRITAGLPISKLVAEIEDKLADIKQSETDITEKYNKTKENYEKTKENLTMLQTVWQETSKSVSIIYNTLSEKLIEEGFGSVKEAEEALLAAEIKEKFAIEIENYRQTEQKLIILSKELENNLNGQSISDENLKLISEKFNELKIKKNEIAEMRVKADKELKDLTVKRDIWAELENERLILRDNLSNLEILKQLFKGDVFIEFLAQEQMQSVIEQASVRLQEITRYRYCFELSSDGSFLIRDEANGGVKRPVSTLSGGETFQASLAMALSLSTHIQLKGKYPLEFFFLDEGFGTLDSSSLETAVSTLEKLRQEKISIGIISHMPEIKHRLHRYLIVEPADSSGKGSTIRLEIG